MFFHILLWNETEDADRIFIESGMKRMQKENLQYMKKLSYGYLLAEENKQESQSGTFVKKNNGFEKIAAPYQSFFVMDFEDEDAYHSYVTSEAHDNPQATHPKPGFAWQVCATMWSKYLATDFLHESAFQFTKTSAFGAGSILHMVLWDMDEKVPEKEVDSMFRSLKKFKSSMPDIGYLSFGRKFLGTEGGESIVHKDQYVPRGTGPLPYEKISNAPRFGLIVEFKNRLALDKYRNSSAHKLFVEKFVQPYWTKIYRHELEIKEV